MRLILGIQQRVFYVKVTTAIIRSQSYGALLGCGQKEDPNSGYVAKQSRRVFRYYNHIRDQNFKRGISSNLFQEELMLFYRQKIVQPVSRKI